MDKESSDGIILDMDIVDGQDDGSNSNSNAIVHSEFESISEFDFNPESAAGGDDANTNVTIMHSSLAASPPQIHAGGKVRKLGHRSKHDYRSDTKHPKSESDLFESGSESGSAFESVVACLSPVAEEENEAEEDDDEAEEREAHLRSIPTMMHDIHKNNDHHSTINKSQTNKLDLNSNIELCNFFNNVGITMFHRSKCVHSFKACLEYHLQQLHTLQQRVHQQQQQQQQQQQSRRFSAASFFWRHSSFYSGESNDNNAKNDGGGGGGEHIADMDKLNNSKIMLNILMLLKQSPIVRLNYLCDVINQQRLQLFALNANVYGNADLIQNVNQQIASDSKTNATAVKTKTNSKSKSECMNFNTDADVDGNGDGDDNAVGVGDGDTLELHNSSEIIGENENAVLEMSCVVNSNHNNNSTTANTNTAAAAVAVVIEGGDENTTHRHMHADTDTAHYHRRQQLSADNGGDDEKEQQGNENTRPKSKSTEVQFINSDAFDYKLNNEIILSRYLLSSDPNFGVPCFVVKVPELSINNNNVHVHGGELMITYVSYVILGSFPDDNWYKTGQIVSFFVSNITSNNYYTTVHLQKQLQMKLDQEKQRAFEEQQLRDTMDMERDRDRRQKPAMENELVLLNAAAAASPHSKTNHNSSSGCDNNVIIIRSDKEEKEDNNKEESHAQNQDYNSSGGLLLSHEIDIGVDIKIKKITKYNA